MKRLFLFNPDNDMALADGTPNYMPPTVIRRMAEDLAVLPAWMAAPADCVLAASAYNDSFLREANSRFGLDVGLTTPPELREPDFCMQPAPWGWSPAVRERLRRAGLSEELLPDEQTIQAVRSAAHRSTAVSLLSRLHIDDNICGESRLLHTVEECREFVAADGERLLKAPLSGSGKGLNWCLGEMEPSVEGWCRQVIERQGAVVGEPVYEKVMDFAMEFEADGEGDPQFVGYSLFTTSRGGAYEKNLLMSDDEIERLVCEKIPPQTLHGVRRALPALLREHIGSYRGFVGVDMMVCLCDLRPTFKLHPCVEVNLRSNMGVLSHYIYKMYMAEGARGVFRVDYRSRAGAALAVHQQLAADYPAVVENDRLVSGYMPLTPVTKNTLYTAYVIAQSH
jgi:hypothetical protein